MKKLYSCLIILTFFTSCTIDSDYDQEGKSNAVANKGIIDTLPLKSNNPYDNLGQLHDELFETYYASGNLPSDIPGIINRVEFVANSNSTFNSIKDNNYQSISPERIEYIVEHDNTCVAEVMVNSSMTPKAKSSLSSFIDSLILFFPKESSGDVLSDFVIKYENAIIENPLFTTNDKRIILITTAIARHSTYMARRKPKKNTDPDWLIFVGNIISATEGAEESSAKAVTMALVAGIVQN